MAKEIGIKPIDLGEECVVLGADLLQVGQDVKLAKPVFLHHKDHFGVNRMPECDQERLSLLFEQTYLPPEVNVLFWLEL